MRKEGRFASTEGGGCFVKVPRRGFRVDESPSMFAGDGGAGVSGAQLTLAQKPVVGTPAGLDREQKHANETSSNDWCLCR